MWARLILDFELELILMLKPPQCHDYKCVPLRAAQTLHPFALSLPQPAWKHHSKTHSFAILTHGGKVLLIFSSG